MSALDFLGIGPALAGQAGETLRYFVRSAADGRELERGPDPGSLAAELGAAYCNLHRADLHAALGVDVVALGEHHRPEYSISTPETVLAGIATRTSRIRLASRVTVLSSDDPVRLFQRFATVDALPQGPGRGDPGTRLLYRVVPVVRLRPEGLRQALRGETRALREAS
jgi:hypothetical protein